MARKERQAGREGDDPGMRQYADTFKARMVRGMLGPNAVSARATTTRTPPTGGPGDGGACHHTASRAAIEKVPVLAALMPQLQGRARRDLRAAGARGGSEGPQAVRAPVGAR